MEILFLNDPNSNYNLNFAFLAFKIKLLYLILNNSTFKINKNYSAYNFYTLSINFPAFNKSSVSPSTEHL